VKNDRGDGRARQVVIGMLIIAGVGVVFVLAFLATFIPGVVGEWASMMLGFVTTPVFLEISFFCIGLMIVLTLNHVRMKKEGDGWVYLERVDVPSAPGDLPEHAKWATYREPPLPGEEPGLLAQAEGAAEIGDYDAAAEAIAAMADEERKRPEVVVLRIRLARATGREELAKRLESGEIQ
jgi:hypothetical protein